MVVGRLLSTSGGYAPANQMNNVSFDPPKPNSWNWKMLQPLPSAVPGFLASIDLLLLMADVLHHMGCINPVNNGINYLSTGAGFQPSTILWPFQRMLKYHVYSQTRMSQGVFALFLSYFTSFLSSMASGTQSATRYQLSGLWCILGVAAEIHMDVSKNRGGPPKWMVYNGKPY